MNKATLVYIIKTSRPRFWLYLAGPYLVGFAFGATNLNNFYSPIFILTLLYFIFPANFFLYAINDYFDQKGDMLNTKKRGRETTFENKNKSTVFVMLGLCLFLTFLIFAVQPNNTSRLGMIVFLLLSIFYSAPPLRFKTKPFLDSSSNFLYFMPGLVGYSAVSNLTPNPTILLCGLLWTSAMHLFSAIPDITPDQRAGFKTTAVLLGQKYSLILVFLLWLGFWIITASLALWFPIKIAAMVYPAIPLYILANPKVSIERIYWFFPKINALGGFLLFWSVFIRFLF